MQSDVAFDEKLFDSLFGGQESCAPEKAPTPASIQKRPSSVLAQTSQPKLEAGASSGASKRIGSQKPVAVLGKYSNARAITPTEKSFFPLLPQAGAPKAGARSSGSMHLSQAEPEQHFFSNQSPPRKQQAAGLSVSAVIPPAARGVFRFDFFNPMQSKSFDAIFNTAENVLVSAPTSSGKTALLELAIVRQVLVHGDMHKPAGQRGKAVYLAPMRAIVDEVATEWTAKFEPLGLKVACLLSGDSASPTSDSQALQEADIVCATPEKWDAITRTWKANKALMGQVSLLLLDEVHFVGDERGAVLEALVSRMMAVQRDEDTIAAQWPAVALRTVALSATLPNVHSMSKWLSAKHVLQFGDEFRPVPLQVAVLGFGNAQHGKEFLHEQGLNKRVFAVIQEHSLGKPSLVFCPTRRGTHAVAKQLCLDARLATGQQGKSAFVSSVQHQQRLAEAAQQCQDQNLRECISQGVGFHTAGLSVADRAVVERAFREGLLRALATTTTLSQGVNLPAHLVVVKSTMQWKGSSRGGYQQYDLSTVLQMIGRAGRPQFDDSGAAVIMTETHTKDLYQKMSSGALRIQSFLAGSMAEYLNTEIALGTVRSLGGALEWLQTTFLWNSMPAGPREAEARQELCEMVTQAVNLLSSKGFIKYAPGQDSRPVMERSVEPCLPCRVASKHALSVTTVEHLIRSFIPHLLGDDAAAPPVQAAVSEEFFWYTVCHSQEFSRTVRLRQGDKKQLNQLLRAKKTRWRLTGNRVKSLEDKVFVLVQLKLGGTNPGSYDLQMDARACLDILARIAKALVNILSSDEVCSSLVVYAHTMYRSAVRCMWATDPLPLKQLDSLRRHFKKLGDLNIVSMSDLIRLHETDLKDLVKLPQAAVAAAKAELAGVVPVEVAVTATKQSQGRMWDVVIKLTAAVPRRLGDHTLEGPVWAHGWLLWLLDAEGRLVSKLKVRRYEDAELTLSVPESAVMNNLSLSVQHAGFLSMDVMKSVTLDAAVSGGSQAGRQVAGNLANPQDIFGAGDDAGMCSMASTHSNKPAETPVQSQARPKRPAPAQSDLKTAFARTPKKARSSVPAKGNRPITTPKPPSASTKPQMDIQQFAFSGAAVVQPQAAAQPDRNEVNDLWSTLL